MGPPDPVPGLLLGIIAIALINRNRWFLVGQQLDPNVRRATLQALLDCPRSSGSPTCDSSSSVRGSRTWWPEPADLPSQSVTPEHCAHSPNSSSS